jgi:predicted amidohydrolase
MLQAAAEEHGLFVVSSCLTGFESGKGLAGGSMIFDPFGRMLAEAPILEEAMIVAELDPELVRSARERSPLLRDLRRRLPDLLRQAARIADSPERAPEPDGWPGLGGAEPVS